MEDRFGHRISYLRVPVTDRCNERCRYCLPDEEQEWLPRDDVLSCEEMLRMMALGVDAIMTDRPLLLEELLNTPPEERSCD